MLETLKTLFAVILCACAVTIMHIITADVFSFDTTYVLVHLWKRSGLIYADIIVVVMAYIVPALCYILRKTQENTEEEGPQT